MALWMLCHNKLLFRYTTASIVTDSIYSIEYQHIKWESLKQIPNVCVCGTKSTTRVSSVDIINKYVSVKEFQILPFFFSLDWSRQVVNSFLYLSLVPSMNMRWLNRCGRGKDKHTKEKLHHCHGSTHRTNVENFFLCHVLNQFHVFFMYLIHL